jgi:Nuclease-related domain.
MTEFWYICALITFLIIAVCYRLLRPRLQGAIGEKKISLRLAGLDQSKYRVVNSVILNVRGRSTQSDYVVVSNFGIFVIETKNCKGWIFGGEHSEYWTQVIYKWKNKFYCTSSS